MKINETLVEQVRKDNKALKVALVGLFERQTRKEIELRSTRYVNTQGFYPRDVKFLQPAAEDVQAGRRLGHNRIEMVRFRVAKYRRQVTEILTEAGLGVTTEASAS